MYITATKRPRKLDRRKSARNRAKLKAKNDRRRARVGQHGK